MDRTEVSKHACTDHFIELFLAMLGLHCCTGFSPVAASRGYSLAVACRLLIAEVACLAVEEHEPCMCSRAHGSVWAQ